MQRSDRCTVYRDQTSQSAFSSWSWEVKTR